MPAAVIPAPIAYNKVVDVTKLVVGFLPLTVGLLLRVSIFPKTVSAVHCVERYSGLLR